MGRKIRLFVITFLLAFINYLLSDKIGFKELIVMWIFLYGVSQTLSLFGKLTIKAIKLYKNKK